jgi:hypothetical protein
MHFRMFTSLYQNLKFLMKEIRQKLKFNVNGNELLYLLVNICNDIEIGIQQKKIDVNLMYRS